MAPLCVSLTLAKGGKWVAQLFSSRKWDDMHFMSDGVTATGANTNSSAIFNAERNDMVWLKLQIKQRTKTITI